MKDKNYPYFTAAPFKFVLLSVCTFGFYDFYWFYKNWQRYRLRTGRKVWPTWRATFAPLTAYGMFRDIENHRAEEEGPGIAFTTAMAAAYFLLWFSCYFLPFPLTLLKHVAFVPLLVMNNRARAFNRREDPDWRENARLGFLNVLTILIGGGIVVMSVFGVYMQGTGGWEKIMKNSPYAEQFEILSQLQ